ncbi:30S ribosomal protein S2 [Candidatus Cyrtobacter comes]|nr:30S ribosomal protein S2 [Candidatus Cyrtobacter comes]
MVGSQRHNRTFLFFKMYKAEYTMQQLFEADVHYGHKKNLWNPKMASYIYGVKNGMHIIDIRKTFVMLAEALNAVRDVAAKNGRILFVGTKPQASDIISENARRCGQYYVNHRWLGGMLTNWDTVSKSVKTLQKCEEKLSEEESELTKKEQLRLARKIEKLQNILGGIRSMGGVPDMIFVIDTNEHKIAIQEAKKLGISVVAMVDTNSDFSGVDYIIPANDDATRSIKFIASLISDAIIDGVGYALSESGVDIGASSELSEIEKSSTSSRKKGDVTEKE